MAGKHFLFWQHCGDDFAPFLYSGGPGGLGGSAWQGSGGNCPCASPCPPSGRCPWVSHPGGSRPRTVTSTQFVAVVVCKQWERRAAFHLAASAGKEVCELSGQQSLSLVQQSLAELSPGVQGLTPANTHTQEWEILREEEQSLENRDAKEEGRQKDSRDFTKYFKSILI